MAFFAAREIDKRYGGNLIVENISLSVEKGESAALLGVSGIGKTTLFNIFSGLERPDHGQVLLEGNDVTGRTGQVGYMQQKDLLLPYLKIIDNVALPLTLRGIKKKEARLEASGHLEQFGLTGYGDKYPAQLSGGMRQRAALLRTFLFSGRMLLLDEPFSALDAITKTELHGWYLRLLEETRITTIFITHDIDEAIFLSDKIYVLSGRPGRIAGELRVDFPRRRELEFTMSPEFIACKKKILRLIAEKNEA